MDKVREEAGDRNLHPNRVINKILGNFNEYDEEFVEDD